MFINIYQVDSFTSEPFRGNPAGVCITESALPDTLMLSIAQEMAVSETAFLDLSTMNLRWFTPTAEVELCGHATLATIHIMNELGLIHTNEIAKFQTQSGELLAAASTSGYELDFPLYPVTHADLLSHRQLIDGLGLTNEQISQIGTFDTKHLIEVKDEHIVLNIQPNMNLLNSFPGRGVIVTSTTSRDDCDFISRYFAPWIGIDEDPVTGSAHCALADYWANKIGKTALIGYQASKRGGYVKITICENQRVKLIGNAITTIKGSIRVSIA